MLIGEILPTFGKVYINGYDLAKNFSSARSYLGYCPQFDYLNDYLSVKQTFELFCELRGVEAANVPIIVENLILLFRLHEIEHKIIKNIRYLSYFCLY